MTREDEARIYIFIYGQPRDEETTYTVDDLWKSTICAHDRLNTCGIQFLQIKMAGRYERMECHQII